MTEAQRVGQLFLVGLEGDPVAEAAHAAAAYHFGSWLLGASGTAGVTGTAQLTGAVQSLASAHATDKVRFFIAANQEGGEIQALQGPGFQVMPSALITSQTLDAAAAMDRAILGHIAVDAGFRAVVNSAVMRVLSAKQAYGLLPCSRH